LPKKIEAQTPNEVEGSTTLQSIVLHSGQLIIRTITMLV